jgi:two-component system, cell cycle response regulator DivK
MIDAQEAAIAARSNRVIRVAGWLSAALKDEKPRGDSVASHPGGVHREGVERHQMILVVDDDAANLALARFVLEAEGYCVVEAVDAVSTFEVLKTCEPALIVMDIQLPGMDGWELTRRLKASFATSHIPIVAVTAYGVSGDRERAEAAGAVEFVEKPISTTELPRIIRRHLPPSR